MIVSNFISKEEASTLMNVTVDEIESLIDSKELEAILFDSGDVRILIRSVISYKKRQDQ